MVSFWRNLGQILKAFGYDRSATTVWPAVGRLVKTNRSAAQNAQVVKRFIEALETRQMLAVGVIPELQPTLPQPTSLLNLKRNTPAIR